jgi:hypothetical protein
VPLVQVTARFDGPIEYRRDGELPIPLTIDSQALVPRPLTIEVEGIPDARVVPKQIVTAPADQSRQTISVYLPADARVKSGELQLRISSPDRQVIVQGGAIAVPYHEPAALWPILLAVLLLLGTIGGFAWRIIRSRRQNKQTPPPGAGLRKLA